MSVPADEFIKKHFTSAERAEIKAEATIMAAEIEANHLNVSPDAYQAFLARLDVEPQPNERLKATLSKPAPWDER